jgi:hypothetical protein
MPYWVYQVREKGALAVGKLLILLSMDQAGTCSRLRQISVASPLLVKDQLLIAPVRAIGRHGLVVRLCSTARALP